MSKHVKNLAVIVNMVAQILYDLRVNSFYQFTTKYQEVKVSLNVKLKTIGHKRETVFQLPVLEFKLYEAFKLNVQR